MHTNLANPELHSQGGFVCTKGQVLRPEEYLGEYSAIPQLAKRPETPVAFFLINLATFLSDERPLQVMCVQI
ncbi:hypothetical protein RSOLAG1IB_08635 [Rhizoctonia solani AG-1 IB]|uniref:Uncharacterized protein n=1 Tax=Thanatephorus cucumeris (strain AG1-IB / isolate 7/3/14) TaxID=1108050 RepID=A0A0B7FLM4_THACB|nr:hypothetical protein RSOLAG1IB_08635 [Rhizoctonia solani AG-1 IB]